MTMLDTIGYVRRGFTVIGFAMDKVGSPYVVNFLSISAENFYRQAQDFNQWRIRSYYSILFNVPVF